MTFAQHLDRLLNERPAPAGNAMPDDPYGAWFVGAHTQRPVASVPVPPRSPYGNQATNGPEPEPEPRLLRLWSLEQEDALDDLRSLGAQLTADPTLDDVRTQWRRLARALHPDVAGADADPGAFSLAADAWSALRMGPEVTLTQGSQFTAGLR